MSEGRRRELAPERRPIVEDAGRSRDCPTLSALGNFDRVPRGLRQIPTLSDAVIPPYMEESRESTFAGFKHRRPRVRSAHRSKTLAPPVSIQKTKSTGGVSFTKMRDANSHPLRNLVFSPFGAFSRGIQCGSNAARFALRMGDVQQERSANRLRSYDRFPEHCQRKKETRTTANRPGSESVRGHYVGDDGTGVSTRQRRAAWQTDAS